MTIEGCTNNGLRGSGNASILDGLRGARDSFCGVFACSE
jgi:hypothetical protein